MAGYVIRGLEELLWGWPMILLLLGTHVSMTLRTGFIQRELPLAIRLSVTRDRDAAGDVSQFGALVTALCSTIGTGNILGVGTAIALGGPGAVLWMWLTGLVGMATKYAETLLAMRYRVQSQSGMQGGAMYVLERGLHMPRMGRLFAVLGAVGAFGTGCMVQANAVTTAVTGALPVGPLPVAVGLSMLAGAAILGGIRSIARVAEGLVPLMAVGYVAGCLTLLVLNRAVLGQAIWTILTAAVRPGAALGGAAGYGAAAACRHGVARGLFSNESGMGSAPLAAVSAKTRNPKRQALVSMTGTFWDTGVICLVTGLALVSSMLADPELPAVAGPELAALAFSRIPRVGGWVLRTGLAAFAFTTILGWYCYGERCAVYLLGEKCVPVYKALWVAGVFAGALGELEVIWSLANLLNGLMAIPNLLALLLLRDVVTEETRRFAGDRIHRWDPRPVPQAQSTV